jgi:hypothetical protein
MSQGNLLVSEHKADRLSVSPAYEYEMSAVKSVFNVSLNYSQAEVSLEFKLVEHNKHYQAIKQFRRLVKEQLPFVMNA